MRPAMLRRSAALTILSIAVVGASVASPRFTLAQDPAEGADPEIERQRQIVERFVTVLERNPRRGTALDRIYGYHIENGTLDELVKRFSDRTVKDPEDGVAWMILGLVESQRGRDAAAVEAFTQAKTRRADDPMAAFYLGQSLILVGNPDQAVAAFEEAIARKPPQTDLLAVFQALGRVHQQAQHVEQALAVWARLEKLFPNNPRVQEDIAATLVEEGQFADALPRYEALAKQATDDYRKTVFRMQAADLKIKTKRAAEGIADLEELLKTLNPQNWLFREVRHHVEEVFLRTNDDDGLTKYYERWLATNTEDIDAMARLARVLARQARVPEAQQWLDKALRLAPTRKELRVAFVDQLVDEQRYPEAIAQYVELDKVDPNNPDYLRNWGKLILRDASRPKAERQAEAEKIWRRMTTARPDDPLIAAQVADLFRYAELSDQALELYQKAVEIAPTAPQYREYLGEYYHILKRSDEALATWRKLAEGPQHTAANVTRLAEVLAQFGYLEQALPQIADACQMDPKDFSLQLKAADMQVRADNLADALASLERAEKLAQNDEEHEAVLTHQLRVYTLEGQLGDLVENLRREVVGEKGTARQYYLLARYNEELRDYAEASVAIRKACELDPDSIPALTSAARIAESAGELEQAAQEQRKLAVLDRRGKTDHLRHVAELESQIGRIDAALAAGRELIAAAPGNVDSHQFFAELCFRLGKPDEALQTLRRAVRANPNDQNIVLSLASALASQFRSDEAIELYWQAFDKATALDDRLTVVGKLADLYLQTNHFERLLERLERNRQDAENRRELTICLAQAHQSAGDYGMARQELERLLNENSRDTQLLQQLSKLAEGEADLTSAAAFQEQVTKVAPGPEAEYRLATLLSRAGRSQEAADILVRLAAKEEDKEKLLRNIDGLLTAQEFDTALNAIEPKLRENPKDWELAYREGVALFHRRADAARDRFEALLAIDVPDEEPGIAAKNREKARQKQTSSPQPAARMELPFARVERAYEIRRAIGLDADNYYSSSMARAATWTPQQFSQTRMAALGWLLRLAQKDATSQSLIDRYRTAAEKPDAAPRAMWDWVYLESVRNTDQKELAPFARRLAATGDVAGHYLLMNHLMNRNAQTLRQARVSQQAKDSVAPLKADELDAATRSFEIVMRAMGGRDASNAGYLRASFAQIILAELKRSGRDDEAKKLYAKTVEQATTAMELSSIMQLALSQADVPGMLSAFDRFAKRELQERSSKTPPQAYVRQGVAQSLAAILNRTDSESSEREATQILEHYLKYQAASSNARRNDPRSRSQSGPRRQQQGYVQLVQANGIMRNIPVPYPLANQFFDTADISFWRSLFEWFKQKDLLSDLFTRVDTLVNTAGPGEKIYATLGQGYLHAWNEDPAAAIKSLSAAMEQEPRESELRLDLAQFCLQSQQLEDAMTHLDAVVAANQNALREREMLALDVAVRLGDLERARQAAQRLFGLRLDAETQIQLAGKMRRLGMVSESEAIMARAQRHAGSSLSALAALMGQYQAEGRTELAAEAAHQILRRSRTAPAIQQAMGYMTADSNYRTSALQILAQSGKLKESIARVESQLERSPQSTQLAETLAEYYTAAGDTKKSIDLQGKVIEQHPEDADLRFRYAQLLSNNGKPGEACEQYKLALQKKPALLQNRAYEVVRTFQQAKREAELAKFVGTIDLKAINNPYGVMDLIRNMFNNKAHREEGMVLLRKAWDAFPAQRSQLLQSFYDDAIWKIPEVFEYGRQALMPPEEAIRQNAFSGIDVITSYSQDGRANTVLDRVLSAAVGSHQLEKLRDDVAAHVEKMPDWLGGKALLAVIDLRLKRPADVEAAVKPLLESSTDDYRNCYARWIVGQEIEGRPELRPLAIELFKGAFEGRRNMGNQFQYSPGPRLVKAYLAADQREEARKMLVAAARERADERYDPGYASYQRVEGMRTIAKQLQDADFPVDALRVYRDFLTDTTIDGAMLQQYGGRDLLTTRKEAQAHIDSIIDKLSGESGTAALFELLAPRESAAEDESAIDLLMAATPVGMELPKIDSLLVRFLTTSKLGHEAITGLLGRLDTLAAGRPRDFSVAVAQALVALQVGDADRAQAVLDRVSRLIADVPLEPLGSNGRANARQRADAARQTGLWLLAKALLAIPERRALGIQWADRAVDAAGRQLDPALIVAMLHERGMISLDARLKDDAQRDWNELLERAIIQPRAQSTQRSPSAVVVGNAPPGGVPGSAAPVAHAAAPGVPPTANAKAPGAKPPRGLEIPPVTLSQFQIGAALAQLAAQRDLPTLSLRAMREVVSGGLPVSDISRQGDLTQARRVVTAPRVGAGNARNDVDQQIYTALAQRMWQVSDVWQKKGIEPEEVCLLLEQLVFPNTRPNEILLFEQPLGEDWWTPKSVGRLLANWAHRAGRRDALLKQIDSRKGSPTDVLSGHVLLLQYSFVAGEPELVRAELKAIGQLIDSGKLVGWSETAAHAIGPAFIDARFKNEAAPLLAKALSAVKTTNQSRYEAPSDNAPLTRLLSYYVGQGDLKNAQSLIDEYLKRRQAEYARYSGDSPLMMQRMDYNWAANELCRGQQLPTTLDALAKAADAPANTLRQTQSSLSRAMCYLAQQAGALPAAERYAALRDWTMPSEGRRSVRMVVTIETGQPVPSIFLSQGDIPFDPRPKFAPISNLALLVDAAREAGKLDELAEAVQPLSKDKVPGAGTLEIMLDIARDDTAAAKKKISDLLAALRREFALNASRAANDLSPIVVAYAATTNPATASQGGTILQLLSEVAQNDRYSTGGWLAYGAAQQVASAVGEREIIDERHLQLWIVAHGSRMAATLRPPVWWAADEGCLRRVCGSELDQLMLRYPLAGTFELTAEALIGELPACNFSYGGIGILPTGADQLTVQSLAGNDVVLRGSEQRGRAPNATIGTTQWRKIRLQVADGKARFTIAGWPVFEDRSSSPTSPWFGVFALGNQQPQLRNLKITGTPTIPRRVKLVDGNRLEGWVAGLASTKQPSPTLVSTAGEGRAASGLSETRQLAVRMNTPATPNEANQDAGFDWTAREGVLHGRNSGDTLAGAKGWLSYHRPLLDGESIAYQFYYEPGERFVHPTVGRVAYLLEPDGLRLLWLDTPNRAGAIVAMEPDTSVEDPSIRRTAVRDVLKENAWNDVQITRSGAHVSLSLNGQSVCQRPLDSSDESYVGFYYRRGELAAEIRNVELWGDWPSSLEPAQLANLLAPRDERSSREANHVRERLVGEATVAQNAAHAVQLAQELEPAAGYERLKAWVLPGLSHAGFRLQSDVGADGRRVVPALELVQLAAKLGKLDDLAAATASASESTSDKPSATALEVVLAIAHDDDAAATAALGNLQKQAKQHVQDLRSQWPYAELLAVEAALARPGLLKPALALAEDLVATPNNKNLDRTDWHRVASQLVARAAGLSPTDVTSSTPWTLTEWRPVAQASAMGRALAYPASTWRVDGGQVRYFSSQAQDALFFAVPIAGNFEVRFEQQASRQRGLAVRYGGISFNLSGDAKALVRQEVGHGATTKTLDVKLEKEQPWNEYRLSVQDGKLSVSIAGVPIASEQLSRDCDPWLAVASSERNFLGAIRGLQVLGKPDVPSEVRLSSDRPLGGWHAEYYRESFSPDGVTSRNGVEQADPAWRRQGEEIVGSRLAHADGTHAESLLQYHRPLADDDVLQYEFYWDPGKSDCHPALDQTALLLSPEGVATHSLTAGALDRSDGATDNRTALAGSKPVTLVAHGWNRAQIAVKQGSAIISVNDAQIATLPLDASSQRVFGLFHYRDQSELRVRNVVLTGKWPTQVPPAEQQQLAGERMAAK